MKNKDKKSDEQFIELVLKLAKKIKYYQALDKVIELNEPNMPK